MSVLRILLCLALLYPLLLAFVYLRQRSLQYFPSHVDTERKGDGDFLPWVAKDGEFLGYLRPAGKMRALLLFFHGNAGEALDRSWFARVVPEDVGLILVEYPGYGGKPGEPTQETIFALAERAYEEGVAQTHVPIWVVGESLGSGVACYLASKKPVEKLGLISAFSAALDVAAHAYPFLPVRFLMKDPFPSLSYVGAISAPTHLIHGEADEMIPIEQSRRLQAAFPHGQAVLTEIGGYGHNDIADPILHSPRAEPFRAFLRN